MSATPVGQAVRQGIDTVETWFVGRRRATYGLSAARIMVGTALLGILLANASTRHAVWGPGSDWIAAYRSTSGFDGLAGIFAGESPLVFTLKYVLLALLAIAVIVGWRTRIATALLVIGMTALVERNGLVGDQGDNIARIGLLLMLFMSTAEHWSLDARRRRRLAAQAPRRGVAWSFLQGLPVLPRWFVNPLHNAALMALALQLFILYTASALFKVQGELWQNGTALYYPLSLHEYGVFPALNALLTHNPVLVTAATYFAVYIQLFFAVGLLHPVTRRVALVGVILMHVGIAVLMGLPWFSLSMIAFDAIFVSSATWQRVDAYVRRVVGRLRRRAPQPRPATQEPVEETGTVAVAPTS